MGSCLEGIGGLVLGNFWRDRLRGVGRRDLGGWWGLWNNWKISGG